MTGIERRKFEMLVRVRNFGNTHAELFAALPVAQQTFAAVGTTIRQLTIANMNKMSASSAARAAPKKAARKALTGLLQRAAQLARNLRADGHTAPGFDFPGSKDGVSLLTAGRQFAVDAAAFEAEFSGHGMSPRQITATTDAFETATGERATARTQHVAAKARIHELLGAAIRRVERLDLIIKNDLGNNYVVQAEWTQLRRREDPRGSRNGGGASAPVAPVAPVAPLALRVRQPDTPAPQSA
jgi:hypothetical protein